ncbi:MAG: ABC transporter periplasmic-binding protein YtfQ precursor [Firmicutes bacterium ADurb.Bin467]|nr:MAG: ABC transporter periplasmic-binding protein YtfQ precursor [Firmicutes bacterium ADurb.Bin467]
MRKLLPLFIALLLLTAGCTDREPPPEESSMILGFSQLGSESGWRIGNSADIKAAADRAGVQLMFENAEQKQENQIKAIRSFIAYQVDVIAFSPIIEDGWDNVLREAKEAGIPVILTDRLINTEDPSLYVGYVGSNFFVEGQSAAVFLKKKADLEGLENVKIVELSGTIESSPMRQRAQGFRATLRGDGRFQIIESISGDFLRSKGKECMEHLLAAHGRIDVLYSHNDAMTFGAIEAIEAAGFEPGKDIIIITVDGEQGAIDLLKEGKINCVVECTPLMGTEMHWLLNRLHMGESIASRLKVSFRVILAVLVIPAVISIVIMVNISVRYSAIITHMGQVANLKPKIAKEIPDEVWSAVAGRKRFEDGNFYRMIDEANQTLDKLMDSVLSQNRLELLVARRTMNTLRDYIDKIGVNMATKKPIVESEAELVEVRAVASLVGEMLERYIATEIRAASQASVMLTRAIVISLLLEFALLLLALWFSMLAQKGLSRSVQQPIMQLEHFAAILAAGDLRARVPATSVEELSNLTESFNVMADKLETLIEQNRLEQENLKKAELRTLQTQIAPHFLYNTLDAIVWLAEAGSTDEVIHITRALSDFFRISLSQGRDWIPVSEELKHLRGYLTIQKIRYRDILDYEIDVAEEALEGQILKLLLQPLVENAIYHGIKYRRRGGKVVITARLKGDRLHFAVEDNGPGMPEERLLQVIAGLGADDSEAVGYGLSNVDRRIRLYYGLSRGLNIHSGPDGTRVEFTVPVRRQAGDV